MLKVSCELKTYPDEPQKDGEVVIVRSHKFYSDRVNIAIGKIDVITIGRDLITAIENAMRVH